MKAPLLGASLLRSTISPILPFLAPAVPSSTWSASFHPRSGKFDAKTLAKGRRCFGSLSSTLRAPVSTSEAVKEEEDDRKQNPEPTATPPPPATESAKSQRGASAHEKLQAAMSSVARKTPPRSNPRMNESGTGYTNSIDSMLRNVFPSGGGGGGGDRPPTTRPLPFRNRVWSDSATPKDPNAPTSRSPSSHETSYDVMRAALRHDQSKPLARRQGVIAREMMPKGTALDTPSMVASDAARPTPLPPLPPPVRTDAFTGRAVPVGHTVMLAQAVRHLDGKLAYNNVRGDFMKQRFHERKGLKRKRLKSERWRRRFKEGFKAVVEKVKNMKRQGW